MKTNEEKLLQIVNLSPSEQWMERIVEMHPMRQIFWASIISYKLIPPWDILILS